MNAILIAASFLGNTFTVEVIESQQVKFTVVIAEKQKATVNTSRYPVRGSHWTINGNSRPTQQALLVHLQSGQHYGKWDAEWLKSLSYEELRSLHDDDHEGRVQWSSAKRSSRANLQPARSYYACPNGRCPRVR